MPWNRSAPSCTRTTLSELQVAKPMQPASAAASAKAPAAPKCDELRMVTAPIPYRPARSTARATYALSAEPMGPVRIAAPSSRELVTTASDETFAAQADRCAILAGGDPLSLPPNDEMDRRLIGDALAASQTLVRRWYDDDAGSYDREARALADAGRAEEATEARVRHQLLTGTFTP